MELERTESYVTWFLSSFFCRVTSDAWKRINKNLKHYKTRKWRDIFHTFRALWNKADGKHSEELIFFLKPMELEGWLMAAMHVPDPQETFIAQKICKNFFFYWAHVLFLKQNLNYFSTIFQPTNQPTFTFRQMGLAGCWSHVEAISNITNTASRSQIENHTKSCTLSSDNQLCMH